jgi:integrase
VIWVFSSRWEVHRDSARRLDNPSADPIEGKRQRFSKAGFSTRADARQALNDAIENYEQSKTLPVPAQPPKETLAAWVRIWLRDYAPERCSPKTLERYYGLASYIIDATDGEPARVATTPLADVDHKIIESALRGLLHTKAKRKEHLSPKTVKEVAGVLSVALGEAFRLEKINVNPMLRVKLPKVEQSDARSLTPEEITKLRECCAGDWTFPFIELALATGARRGELLALTWSDIDWLNCSLSISKSVEETDNAGLRIKRPKNGRSRRFRIGQSAVTTLQFQQEQQQEYRRLYTGDYDDNDLIFALPDGSLIPPHKVSQTIIRRMRKASIKDASLHSLRHTHASGLLSKGVPLPAVSSRLGHSDTSITAKTYSHALPDDDPRAAEAWRNFVRGGRSSRDLAHHGTSKGHPGRRIHT